MNSSDNEVLIRILTAYERGGVEEVKRDLGTLNEKTAEQGQATEKAHGGWRAWMHTIHGTSELAKGNVQGLGGALHGISQLLGSSGFGVGAIIGLGGAAIAGVIKHWTEAKQKILEAKQSAAEYGLKVKQVADEKALEEHLKEIEEIATRYNEAVAAAEKLHKAEENLLEAKTKAKLAKIDAREEDALQQAQARGATPDEIAGIKRGFKQARVDAEVEGANEKARSKVEDANTKITEAEGRRKAALEEQAAAAAEVEAQRKHKTGVESTLAKSGITDKDFALSDDKVREKKVEELLKKLAEADKLVETMKGSGFQQSQKDQQTEIARNLREQVGALQAYPEAKKNLENAEAEAKRIKKETGKTIREADVDQRAGEKDLKAANIELQTSVMSGTTKRSATDRVNKDETQRDKERAAEEERKAEEKALKEAFRSDEKYLSGMGKGEHQGNKALDNIDEGIRHAGSSGDPTAMLAQLHTAQQSKDKAVSDYATQMLQMVEGVATHMEMINSRIKALEARFKTQRDDT